MQKLPPLRALQAFRYAAKVLLGYVETGFQELERGGALFRPDSDPGRLTVATVLSFASRWLVPRIESFQRAHLGITGAPALAYR